MYPGPKKPSLLHLQPSHRSTIVWEVSGGDAHRSRRRNPTQARFPALHESMIPILQDLKFDGVARLSSISIDWSLIIVFVERWRPETHTSHLPVGECTITLHDVSVLLGLRIDGDVVTGSTSGVDNGWKLLIQQIFGKAPEAKDKEKNPLKGGRLLLSWLTLVCSALLVDPSEEEVIRYTQSYILQLIDGVLFTDHSGGQVHCMYIPLIQDFGRCRKLAWGAAMLAYLFRELCKSCRTGVEEIAGCLLLLQPWAWTRLPVLAPVPRSPIVENPIWGDRVGPYGIRWCCSLKFTDTTSHVVSTHRLSLDALGPTHFIWQPYSDEILANLPDFWKEGVDLWYYKGPLVCFYIVDPHLPERCMRQFGMIQVIPLDFDFSEALHDINLQGKKSKETLLLSIR
ncbi:Serine/threonine-protein phosphatase 7 long form-like protein [Heracleum sosnowskyi]|uniref:Serine/threonine-protein phosphatase 7 long form-like protein n=1 Tax=Heracleum sosnowskyi TaxID=360622 RepID=A0AAD8IY13_9APIA|nr:Serine/threonine-protein phosphatase 7 long form-like protein [Heracleum sosnowskyi]